MKRKLLKRLLIIVVIISLVFNALLVVGYVSDYHHFGRLVQVSYLIKTQALKPVSLGGLIDGATAGMVKELHDPYSAFLPATDYARLQEQLDGIFAGIGVILDTAKEDQLGIIAIIKDSPAERAGLHKGDLITEVDGQAVARIKATQAADLLRGKIGSEVSLVIYRRGKRHEYRIKREQINLPSVEGKELLIPQNVAYVKINYFGETTGKELNGLMRGFTNQKGIVLDLRDNPGGDLDTAVDAAKWFVPNGPVVHLVYRDGRRETYEVRQSMLKLPLVVLVNGASASAAEILAGAIKDTGSGIIIGQKTFGKGVVQTIYDVGGKAGLKLTTAKYLTPLGNDINQKGIEPEVTVETGGQKDNGNGDPVLSKALVLLRERL